MDCFVAIAPRNDDYPGFDSYPGLLRRWGNGPPDLPSKQTALATALFGGALRAACLEGGRSSLT
jgi:hypothetical protein